MKRDLKAEMMVAAERLLREDGLRGLTTRALARAVPCSEGAIYVHFKDRLDLVLAVLQESLPEMLVPLHALKQSVGEGTPRANLEAAVRGLQQFHQRVTPMLCSLFMERELLERFRASLKEEGRGPERGIATLATYIAEEQKLGRIGTRVNASASAAALMAGSFFHCFTQQLLGSEARLDVEALVSMAIGE
jgi:AcrR family transcriptional regulator